MMAPVDTSGAMISLQAPALTTPGRTTDPAVAKRAAEQFEGVFITQFLGEMFAGISSDGPTGGGQGEEMFRSMMVDQYAKGLTARGGFGLATAMQAELMKHQQVAVAQ